MDAPAAESQLNRNDFATWLARNRATGRVSRYATLGVSLVLIATAAFSVWVDWKRRSRDRYCRLLIALLLVANLIPAIALMVLFAARRPEARGEGRARKRQAARAPRHPVLDPGRRSNRPRRDLRIAPVPERHGILVLRSRPEHAREHRRDPAGRLPGGGRACCDRDAHHERRHCGISPACAIDDPRFAEGFLRQVLNLLSEAVIINVSIRASSSRWRS